MSQHSSARPSRRRLMQTGAAALALGAPAFVRKANAQSKFDWKRFAGQKIDVVLVKSPRADIYQRYEKEFTELTGIKVSSEQMPEQQQRQKVMIEFASGKPSFDVSGISLHVQKRMAAKGKWFEDLRPIIAERLADLARFRLRRFRQPARSPMRRQADGALDTIPIFVDYWMIYYNKELFDAKGVDYPKIDGRDVRRSRPDAARSRRRASPASSRAA